MFIYCRYTVKKYSLETEGKLKIHLVLFKGHQEGTYFILVTFLYISGT